MCGGLGRVCATGMYRSIEHVKFLKFQTGIFVELKAPFITTTAICINFASLTLTCKFPFIRQISLVTKMLPLISQMLAYLGTLFILTIKIF